MSRRIKRWWNRPEADRLLLGPSGDWISVRRALDKPAAPVPVDPPRAPAHSRLNRPPK